MYSLLLPSQLLHIQLKEQREAKKVKLQVKGISTQTLCVFWKFLKLQANKLQTCHSPVPILDVRAGSPIKARVTGVGCAEAVGHVPGSTSTHGHGRHLYWDQGQRTWVHQAGWVTDAQLCNAATRCPTVCVHTLVDIHLAHVHAQQGLQLQYGGGRDDQRK